MPPDTRQSFPETARKLREARFFLGHMQAEERKPIRQAPEAFPFYLSAFLSAARSITFVLQAELGGEERYRPLFDKWLNGRDEDERDLLKFMNDQRRAEVHILGSDTTRETEEVPIHLIAIGKPFHPAQQFSYWGSPGTPPPTMGVMTYSFTDEGSVSSTCQSGIWLCSSSLSETLLLTASLLRRNRIPMKLRPGLKIRCTS